MSVPRMGNRNGGLDPLVRGVMKVASDPDYLRSNQRKENEGLLILGERMNTGSVTSGEARIAVLEVGIFLVVNGGARRTHSFRERKHELPQGLRPPVSRRLLKA